MNVYQTDIDGVFLGNTTADQDPMDAGNMLIPAGCVETAPPSTTDTQLARWDGTSWTVEDIPQPTSEPDPVPKSAEETARSERDWLLSSSDWTQVTDAPVNSSSWATYRQALRDVPAQAGFPNSVTWPTKPT